MIPTLRLGLTPLLALIATLATAAAPADTLRERLAELRDARTGVPALALPAGARLLEDIPYGAHPRQRFDAYLPAQPAGPVVLMVHGGGWQRGDKAMRGVVANKAARWLPRGIVFVSTNYRFVPDAAPRTQADDIAAALARVQALAQEWGADADRVVLMGHSAGGHLVALLAADPAIAAAQGARPWPATVALDSGAFDVVQTMQAPHPRLFDRAFGADPDAWRAASPLHRLGARPGRLLAVCSSTRRTPCPQAQAFAAKAGAAVTVLPQALSHRDINTTLGLPGDYTAAVEAFLAGADAGFARVLTVQ